MADDPVAVPSHLRKVRLRRVEASQYIEAVHGIPIAPTTLARLASTGGGPPYETFNRTVFYRRGDLDAWIEAKLVRMPCDDRQSRA